MQISKNYRSVITSVALAMFWVFSLSVTPFSTPSLSDTFWYIFPVSVFISLGIAIFWDCTAEFNCIDLLFIILLFDLCIVNLFNGLFLLSNTRFVSSICGILIYFFIKIYGNNKATFYTFVSLLSAIALYQIFISISIIIFRNVTRVNIGGLFLHSGYNAQYLAVSTPALYFLVNRFQKTKIRIIVSAILTAFVLFLIVFLESRSGLVSLSVGLIVWLQKKWSAKSVVVVIIIAVVVFFLLTFLKTGSSSGRLLILHASISHFFEFFPFGKGSSSYTLDYINWQADYFTSHPQSAFYYNASDVALPFNEWLLYLIENGLLWVVSLFLVIITSFFKIDSIQSGKNRLLKSVLAVIVIQSFTSNVLQITTFLIIFFASLGFISPSLKKIELRRFLLTDLRLSIIKKVVAVVLGTALLIISFISINHTGYLYKWQMERRKPNPNYEALLQSLDQNPIFLYQYALQSFEAGDYNKSLSLLTKLQMKIDSYDVHILKGLNLMNLERYPDAEKEYLFCSNYIPHRLYPIYLVMKNYEAAGNLKSAKIFARKLLAMTPKITSTLSDDMRAEAVKLVDSK